MKVLLHICCAPCTIYPLKVLRAQGNKVLGLFFNPNIHPYLEHKKRLDTLIEYSNKVNLKIIYDGDYPAEDFFRNVAFREADRCRYCYYSRLRYAAHIAKKGKFESFTTTLLYSKYQNHELIKSFGESIAKETGIPFSYDDFREGWKEGIEISKKIEIYRQQYCGCLYSEKERFYKKHKIM